VNMILILGFGAEAITACRLAIRRGFIPYAPEVFFPTFVGPEDLDLKNHARETMLDQLVYADEIWLTGDEISEDQAELIRKAKKLNKPVKLWGGVDLLPAA